MLMQAQLQVLIKEWLGVHAPMRNGSWVVSPEQVTELVTYLMEQDVVVMPEGDDDAAESV